MWNSIPADVRWSLKWALILIVPIAAATTLLALLLGGIEGAGKAVFLVVLAPMFALDSVTTGLEGPLAWGVFAIVEFSYVFLLLTIGRVLWRRFV